MAVPRFEEILLPLLEVAADQKEHTRVGMVDEVAQRMGLSQADREELVASGRQRKFDDRVGWARTYLTQARLLETVARGKFRITPRGLEVLDRKPARIDVEFLRQFPEFREFEERSRGGKGVPNIPETPEERLEAAYQEMRNYLAQELLEQVQHCSASRFERLVVDLLVAMGYGGSVQDAGQAMGGPGDEGIDGVIKEDPLGLDVICVQAKRWKNTVVGRPVVQAFVGSMMGRKAKKGVFITTSQFSEEARRYVEGLETKVVLIDGQQLAQLMIDRGIGVSDVCSYTVKKVDSDYFLE